MYRYLISCESATHNLTALPLTSSTFAAGLLQAANATSAAYLFQPDKLNAALDIGDKTIMCGRR